MTQGELRGWFYRRRRFHWAVIVVALVLMAMLLALIDALTGAPVVPRVILRGILGSACLAVAVFTRLVLDDATR